MRTALQPAIIANKYCTGSRNNVGLALFIRPIRYHIAIAAIIPKPYLAKICFAPFNPWLNLITGPPNNKAIGEANIRPNPPQVKTTKAIADNSSLKSSAGVFNGFPKSRPIASKATIAIPTISPEPVPAQIAAQK